MSIHVMAPGLQTTVQDRGRHGHASSGIGHAGAMDEAALRVANILVRNVENAAALEIALRGPTLHFAQDTLIAITGAPIDVRCDGEPVPAWRPVAMRGGNELAFGGMPRGTCAYLAVAGGIDADLLLGSRSVDINAALGPNSGRALAKGDDLACDADAHARCPALWRDLHGSVSTFAAVPWSLDPRPWFDADPRISIRAIPGAHFSRLDKASQNTLWSAPFRVGNDSNRVGYRLEGQTLALREPLELVSEGVVPGSMQLPPAGLPIVLMAEAPTCGGYPRIAQVIAVDLPRLAQRRPGSEVRYTPTSLEDAQTRYLRRERALTRIALTIAERLHA
jgi:antagonist of KipI